MASQSNSVLPLGTPTLFHPHAVWFVVASTGQLFIDQARANQPCLCRNFPRLTRRTSGVNISACLGWQCFLSHCCSSSPSMLTLAYFLYRQRLKWTAHRPLSSRCGRHVMLLSSWDHSLTPLLAMNCPSSRCWNLRSLLNCLLL